MRPLVVADTQVATCYSVYCCCLLQKKQRKEDNAEGPLGTKDIHVQRLKRYKQANCILHKLKISVVKFVFENGHFVVVQWSACFPTAMTIRGLHPAAIRMALLKFNDINDKGQMLKLFFQCKMVICQSLNAMIS